MFCKENIYKMFKANYKIVPLANLNKYLYNSESEIKANINNSREKDWNNTLRIALLVIFNWRLFKVTPHRSVRTVLRASKQNCVGAVFVSNGSELESGSSELIPYSLLEK